MRVYSSWKDFPKREWLWPDFSPAELACRGTGKLAIDPQSMNALQNLRKVLGRPMIVNSAYRSPEHNTAVGGATNSQHMRGTAFDISMANHDPAAFIRAAEQCGFRGIGTYPGSNFIHIDTRAKPARWGKPFAARDTRFAAEQPAARRRPRWCSTRNCLCSIRR